MSQSVNIIGAWSDDWRNDVVILHIEQIETDGTVSEIKHTYRKSDPYGGEFRDILTDMFHSGTIEILPMADYPVIADPEPDAPSFDPLSPVEFRNALIDADIMPADITAAISQIPDIKEREKALNYWNYPTMFHRDNPLIEQIADGFGLTSEDIDQMWLNVLNARQ